MSDEPRQQEAEEVEEVEVEAAEVQAAEAAPSTEAEAVEQDLGELQEKARERDEYLALAQRTQADFENYRKRVARDTAAAEGRGMARLAKELLPALDNLARALESDAPDPEGLRLVRSEFTAALERLGIEEFSPEGERFDPNLHEAMAQQPVDGAESGTVVEVYERGYRIDGNVLRPARVVVAQ
ncbi:MAG TPA: nucleotide exchange factor GrpE [Solirubrobacteraceae bacterium]|nr:nucleotide exchange factor GrpE [Solirubrobacteraceae bacterium]